MRGLFIIGVITAGILQGCASQLPVLTQREVVRLHTMKAVYVQPSQELRMVTPAASGGAFPMANGGVLVLLDHPEVDLSTKYLSQYQDEIATLDARKRILAIATQVTSQVPRLATAPLEVVDGPMDNEKMWQYVQDSSADAVVFFVPIIALTETAHDLHVRMQVFVYINPHTKASYVYDATSFGDDHRVQIPGEKPQDSIRDAPYLHPQDAVAIWFGNDAAELRADIDANLPVISAGLTRYLVGDAPAKGN